ncbi:TonB family protein [Microbulbifer aggregans]|uniref:TonB family protein n=1 Tax=Microbulbifer aggregans TaxID=1769779 RepID=UPI001CFC66B8|nr:TonB family protein [Microbulbifer aggregans]
MKTTKLVIALLLFAAALTANAVPLLNGLALEQQFNKDRYIAAVYSERLSDNVGSLLDNNTPRSLEVRIIAERLSARRFRNQWLEGIAINNPGNTLSSQAQNMVTFANLFKGRFVAGDQLRIDYAADSGTTSVSLNGVALGEIQDREFFNTLLRAWIGAVPPSSDFRDNLLRAGQVESGLLASYEGLAPAGDRIAQVKQMAEGLSASEDDSAVAASEPAKAEPAQVAATPKPDLKADIPAPTLAALGTSASAAPAPSRPEQPAAKPAAKQVAASKPQPLKPTTTRTPEPDDEFEEEEEAPLTADMILARQIYHSMLIRHTFKNIRYPKRAQERGQEGSVLLNVTIDAKGKIKDVTSVQESRYASLNREAVDAVNRSEPYPATPAQLSKKDYQFSLPITFRLPD